MSARATVLYDAPGPVGRRVNTLLSLIALTVLLAALGWVGWTLDARGQLDAEKWQPFLQPQTWTTYLLPGLWGTLTAAFASILLAVITGVVLGLGRLSESRPLGWLCGVIVEFFRAIPVLLLMIFTYQLFAVYGLVPPQQLAFSAVVVSLTLYNGSVIAEILRAGITSLPAGQSEAARALGLSHRQTMWKVLLPQAIAAMLPALISQMVIALKDSALGYQIGYVEIVRSGVQASSVHQNYLASLIVVAIIMVLINWGLTALAERVERWLRAGRARRTTFTHMPDPPGRGIGTTGGAHAGGRSPGHWKVRNPAE